MVDDPMERLVEEALRAAGVEYVTDYGGGNPSGLDFLLPQEGVEIEVKQFHAPRIAEQMSRAENVIAAQGAVAVRFLARLLAQWSPRYTGPIEVGMEFTGFGPVRVVNTGHYPASSGDPAVLVQALDKSYTGAPEWWMPEAYFRMKALPRAAGENVQEAA